MPHTVHIIIPVAALLGVATVATMYGRAYAPRTTSKLDTSKLAHGYLSANEVRVAAARVPAPPAPNSLEMREDEQARNEALGLRGTARYALAAADSVRAHPQTIANFECAFGIALDREHTPRLSRLLAAMRVDVNAAAFNAKRSYQRKPPFLSHGERPCSPGDEELVQDMSTYPSARAAVGWAYGLVLSDLNPDHAQALLDRAREFTRSRVVCDAQWLSDVEAGRAVGAEVVSLLRQKPQFRSDLASARSEVAEALRSRAAPSKDCKAEALALAAPTSKAASP